MANPLLTKFSLSELISKLHSSLLDLVSRLDKAVEINSSIDQSEILELRKHITDRLSKGEEIDENKELLSVLNLLAVDKGVMAFMREEAEEWLAFVEAIENRIKQGGEGASEEERKELEEIGNALDAIKTDLRK